MAQTDLERTFYLNHFMAGKQHETKGIRIVGARENNLRNLTVTLPEYQVVALAGASGAGKSTLAHQILAATARRRLGRLRGEDHLLAPCYQPQVTGVESLPPCIEFKQEPLRGQSRSTVATYSGVLDLLAGLFLGFGNQYSLGGKKVLSLAEANLAEWASRHHTGKILAIAKVCADISVSSISQLPVRPFLWRDAKSEWIPATRSSIKSMLPARGSIAEFEQKTPIKNEANLRSLPRPKKDNLIWLVDDLILDAAAHAVAEDDPLPYEIPSRRLFSFNSSLPGSGRCPHCAGLGVVQGVDESSLIHSNSKPLLGGGLNLARNSAGRFSHLGVLDDILRGLFSINGLPSDLSWERCPEKLRQMVMHGSGNDPVPELRQGETKPRVAKRPFAGIVPLILAKARSAGPAAKIFQVWLSETKCPECEGSRFNRSARAFEWRGNRLADLISRRSISELGSILHSHRQATRNREKELLGTVDAIISGFLQLNLGHLPLTRSTASLSGGEAQRLKLGLGLTLNFNDICYILDEPSRGLHSKDVAGLAAIFRSIVQKQNSIILVEHQPLLLQQADHLMILGPGGGREGGSVVYQGVPEKAVSIKADHKVSRDESRATPRTFIEINDFSLHNLRNVDYRIPIGCLSAVAGVSGAGKSTAILLGLVPAVQAALESAKTPACQLQLPSGVNFVEIVGQKLAGRNRRSIVATALEMLDSLRAHFAALPESKVLGLNAGDFSFNSTGACKGCGGSGMAHDGFGEETDMRCHLCDGTRLSETALLPRSEGSSIADLLGIPISALAESSHPAFDETSSTIFSILIDLDLGYLSLNRATSTLSAGERQRLALARFLTKLDTPRGAGLLVLDEPTAGLNSDAAKRVFERIRLLTEREGHTAIVLEHKIDLIPLADWILEFGPGGGPEGGNVIFQGSPEVFFKEATPTATAWKQHGRKIVVVKGRNVSGSDNSGEIEFSWKTCVETFEAFATKGEIRADTEISRNIRSAVYLNPERIPANTRVGELLDLLSGLRNLGKPQLPANAKECLHGNSLVTELNGVAFGFSPVSSQWRLGVATPSDLAQAVSTLQKIGFREGYAKGQRLSISNLQRKINSLENLSSILVVCPASASTALREIALKWGLGVVHLLDEDRQNIITSHFLSQGMIGLNLNAPHVGDFRSPVGRCAQCVGSGFLPAYEWELIVADSSRPISDDRFWIPSVLSGIRSLRRLRLLPEANFFAKQLIADFHQAPDCMDTKTRMLFEHGIPWRNFPKATSARSDRKQDYYAWRGLHDYVYLSLGSIKDASYRQRLKESFKEIPCPVCNGTGMGWEATLLKVKSRSLADIWRNLPLKSWQTKIGFDSPALQSALNLELGRLCADDRFGNLNSKDQEKLLIAACAAGPLKNLTVLSPRDDSQSRNEIAHCGMKIIPLQFKKEG